MVDVATTAEGIHTMIVATHTIQAAVIPTDNHEVIHGDEFVSLEENRGMNKRTRFRSDVAGGTATDMTLETIEFYLSSNFIPPNDAIRDIECFGPI
mmetsp:Transcript_1/g.9  ORF Transcript_1/g.9 Transcript_1/m.9 type:complete len:96 (+) Transcript_1:2171-2458(+)